MSYVAHQVAAQLLQVLQAICHRVEGMSQRAHFILCAYAHALAQIALLHAISDARQLAHRLENMVTQRQGQQQGQQPGQHSHYPERVGDCVEKIL